LIEQEAYLAMVPGWLTVVSCVSLAVAFLCAGIILYDILVRGYRQHMWIMEAVWPLTSLYFGPLVLWVYCRWGRSQSHKWMEEHDEEQAKKGFAASVCLGVSHCGASCTLGDIVGEWGVFLSGWKLAGPALLVEDTLQAAIEVVLGDELFEGEVG
jgi:hypothetical protein